MCLNCSVIGWYARLDVVHPLSLFAVAFPPPLPVSSLPPSLSFRRRFILRFSYSSCCVLATVSWNACRVASNCSKSSFISSTLKKSSGNWLRMKTRNRIRWIADQDVTPWVVSEVVAYAGDWYSRSEHDLPSDQTLVWLATIRDIDRYPCVKRKNGDEERTPSKWRVVHASRSIVGYEFRGSCGAPC